MGHFAGMRRPLGGFIVGVADPKMAAVEAEREQRQRVEKEAAVTASAERERQHRIGNLLEKIMAKLEDLLDAVASQQTQIDSLITLTEGLHKQTIAAMGSTITPSQQMRIDQVFAQVGDNAADIAAAIKENTIEATVGAVSGGQSLNEIKAAAAGTNPDPAPADAPAASAGDLGGDPGPAVGDAFTDPVKPVM
jgi:hypothetical protein